MKYMLLIYTPEDAPLPVPPEQYYQGYFRFRDEVTRAGAMQSGAPLQPTATAKSVRVRDGETLTTDGPFAETKEQLGGFFILDCASPEQAIAYAAKIPGALYGTVEVRPLMAVPEG